MTSLGTQGCCLFATLRLQMWVRRRDLSVLSQRILATGRPTVPKPMRATRVGRLVDASDNGSVSLRISLAQKMNSLSYVRCVLLGNCKPSVRGEAGRRIDMGTRSINLGCDAATTFQAMMAAPCAARFIPVRAACFSLPSCFYP